MRLDKWLWAARFYKTRSQAAEAVQGGKIHVNGSRAKPARLVRIGDTMRVRKEPYEYNLVVTALSAIRRGAEWAHTLYRESDDSVKERERIAAQAKLDQVLHSSQQPKGRPTKRDRRALERLKRGW
jgi:ribosome-associated heat shock protein Hsp15